jgi:hypothetical protein
MALSLSICVPQCINVGLTQEILLKRIEIITKIFFLEKFGLMQIHSRHGFEVGGITPGMDAAIVLKHLNLYK